MTYLFLFLSFAGCEASKSKKSIPTIAEQFTLRTTEIDDTNHGTISVQQTIFFDRTNRRSHMVADGTLCQGHVEEIIRCDAGRTSGYTLTMGGPPGQHPSQWDCTNRTLFHLSPSTCPFAPFFSFPDNATYVGVTNITQHNISFPVVCDAWMFWKAGEQWMFYAQKDASVPARIQKIRTFHSTNHVWHIDFTHFAPGPPEPLSVFAPPSSVTCKKTVPLTLKSSKQVRGCGVGIDFDRRRRRNDIQRKKTAWKTEQTTSTSRNTVTVYNHTSQSIALLGQRLLSELDARQNIYHANTTLWSTKESSFHLFATNRTEHCHYHPRETVSTTLKGTGAFRVAYSSPIVQHPGDLFVIPKGKPHAFGPVVGGSPVLVSVMWSPPAGHFDEDDVWVWDDDVTIFTTGCVM